MKSKDLAQRKIREAGNPAIKGLEHPGMVPPEKRAVKESRTPAHVGEKRGVKSLGIPLDAFSGANTNDMD
jgi:hypothetical protein